MGKSHSIEKFELVPGRVEAAMQYVKHCQWLTDPISLCDFGNKGRALTPPEQAAYLAALEALRMYFTAEMDFGGPPPRLPEKDAKEGEGCEKCRAVEGRDDATRAPKKSKKLKKDHDD